MGIAKPLPDANYLNSILDYRPDTGEFFWRINKRGRGARIGAPAGTWKSDGYLSIMVDRHRYPAQRLAWKMVTGSDPGPVIDHKDGNSRNNKFSNLRDADLNKNVHNTALARNNTTGFKCVFYHKNSGLYQARINAKGRTYYLGYFKSAKEAAQAANDARPKLHGEFACDGQREAA